ncbi:Hsp20/alpha crystallin family protein [Chloroflexota bacterium]
MYKEKDELVLKAELPGIKKGDLDIILEADMLTIRAEKKQEEVAEDATHYACERYFGQYTRTVSLPFHVDADKTSATLRNGLLQIRLPKAEEAKSKHIEVNVR